MKQSTRTPVRALRQRLVPQAGSRRPCASAPWRGREGAAPLGIVFWMVALALFVLPFLQAPAAPDWDAEDPNRNEETDYPYADDVASFDEYAIEEDLGLEGTLAETIATQSEELYGPGSDRLRDSGLVDVTRLASGRKEYELHCAGCHSMIGDGAGPAARYLHPRPRNFRKGIYKFKSTSSGERPVRTDLFQKPGRDDRQLTLF